MDDLNEHPNSMDYLIAQVLQGKLEVDENNYKLLHESTFRKSPEEFRDFKFRLTKQMLALGKIYLSDAKIYEIVDNPETGVRLANGTDRVNYENIQSFLKDFNAFETNFRLDWALVNFGVNYAGKYRVNRDVEDYVGVLNDENKELRSRITELENELYDFKLKEKMRKVEEYKKLREDFEEPEEPVLDEVQENEDFEEYDNELSGGD